jgi:hypothetical protein
MRFAVVVLSGMTILLLSDRFSIFSFWPKAIGVFARAESCIVNVNTVVIPIVTLWAVPLTMSGMSMQQASALRSMPSLMQPYHGVKPFPDRHAGSSRSITRGFAHLGTETSQIPHTDRLHSAHHDERGPALRESALASQRGARAVPPTAMFCLNYGKEAVNPLPLFTIAQSLLRAYPLPGNITRRRRRFARRGPTRTPARPHHESCHAK